MSYVILLGRYLKYLVFEALLKICSTASTRIKRAVIDNDKSASMNVINNPKQKLKLK